MLEIRGVTKTYRTKKGGETHALRGVTLAFPARGLVFLLGKSGSGKSTLLNILGGLDRPDAGELIAYGRSSAHFTEEDFDSYRNTCVGFIFQEYNLLDEFTVEENVALALELQGMKRGTDDARRALAAVCDRGLIVAPHQVQAGLGIHSRAEGLKVRAVGLVLTP